jgi:NADPH:quinone reductase-like Zn-dependent oxidoreductase
MKSLGADRVIDYTREDFTQSGETYDVLFDTVGKTSLSSSLESVKPGGVYLQAAASPALMIQMRRAAGRTGKTLIAGTANPTADDLVYVTELVQTGKLKPVIDRCYPLHQMVEAHRYVDQGHKKGNVVIAVAQSNNPKQQL